MSLASGHTTCTRAGDVVDIYSTGVFCAHVATTKPTCASEPQHSTLPLLKQPLAILAISESAIRGSMGSTWDNDKRDTQFETHQRQQYRDVYFHASIWKTKKQCGDLRRATHRRRVSADGAHKTRTSPLRALYA